MTSKIYYVYHIPGYRWKNGRIGKIGLTYKDLATRTKGYTDFELLETHTDIYVASDREQELQRQYGYPVDKKPYWKTVAAFQKSEVRAKRGASQTGKKRGPQSQEHRDKRIDSLKGRTLSQEHRDNLSAAKKLSWERRRQQKLIQNTNI